MMRRQLLLLSATLGVTPALAGTTEALTTPASARVWLSRLEVTLGSTPGEVALAALACNRDAGAAACTPETFADELGGPRVVVESFWLDRHEVSYREYQRCVEAGRCSPARYDGAERLERDDLPVVFVTYDDARAYCSFRGARLPSEAEFERAARGAERRVFPWGSRFHGRAANHGRWGALGSDDSDGALELSPVSEFADGQSPEGIRNLSGNVAEWTSTPYAPYTDVDRPGPDRVVRGGHFLAPPARLRGAARSHEPANTRAAYLGFRCAMSASTSDVSPRAR